MLALMVLFALAGAEAGAAATPFDSLAVDTMSARRSLSSAPSLQSLAGLDFQVRGMTHGRITGAAGTFESRRFEITPPGIRIVDAAGRPATRVIPWSDVGSVEIRKPGAPFLSNEDVGSLGILAGIPIGIAAAVKGRGHFLPLYGTYSAVAITVAVPLGGLGMLGNMRTGPWTLVYQQAAPTTARSLPAAEQDTLAGLEWRLHHASIDADRVRLTFTTDTIEADGLLFRGDTLMARVRDPASSRSHPLVAVDARKLLRCEVSGAAGGTASSGPSRADAVATSVLSVGWTVRTLATSHGPVQFYQHFWAPLGWGMLGLMATRAVLLPFTSHRHWKTVYDVRPVPVDAHGSPNQGALGLGPGRGWIVHETR